MTGRMHPDRDPRYAAKPQALFHQVPSRLGREVLNVHGPPGRGSPLGTLTHIRGTRSLFEVCPGASLRPSLAERRHREAVVSATAKVLGNPDDAFHLLDRLD